MLVCSRGEGKVGESPKTLVQEFSPPPSLLLWFTPLYKVSKIQLIAVISTLGNTKNATVEVFTGRRDQLAPNQKTARQLVENFQRVQFMFEIII